MPTTRPGFTRHCFEGPPLERLAITGDAHRRPAVLPFADQDVTLEKRTRSSPEDDDSFDALSVVELEDGRLRAAVDARLGTGLRTWDEILRVGGGSTTGMLPEEVAELLRGESGSRVRVTVQIAEGVRTVNILRP